ncbi:MAG: nuclear transport factor 2 family protein [Pyrinomonadaceae bacterium]|nr:nuclear transport factor 2 family protein [Sphingobacteriaceae bacterium]
MDIYLVVNFIISQCVEKTFSSKDIFILGTNPSETFTGKEGAKRLLHGDWAYWGEVKFLLDGSRMDQYNNAVYVAMGGEIKIDIWHLRFPLRITAVMLKENSNWLISKLQFQYDMNTNLIIFSLLTAIGFSVSLVLTLAMLLWSWMNKKPGFVTKYRIKRVMI